MAAKPVATERGGGHAEITILQIDTLQVDISEFMIHDSDLQRPFSQTPPPYAILLSAMVYVPITSSAFAKPLTLNHRDP